MVNTRGGDWSSAARQLGVRRIISTLFALVGGIYLLTAAIPRLEVQLGGVQGRFQAQECRLDYDADDDGSLKCSGSFRADDGSFAIPAVSVDTTFDEQPRSLIAVVVDGPDARTAVLQENRVWLWPGLTGVVLLAGFAWSARTFWRTARPRTVPTRS